MTPLLQFMISSEMPLSGFSLIREISSFMGQSRSHWMGIATQAQKAAAQELQLKVINQSMCPEKYQIQIEENKLQMQSS